jgi:hypothetical protein
MADTPRRKVAKMAKPEWMNQSFAKSAPKTQSKQINGVKDCGPLFHKQKVAHYADGSEGGVFENIGNFFKNTFSSEAQARRDEEATKEAITTANNKGSGDTGLWDRLKAGNIDDPKSEAYYRWGAGKDKAAETKAKDDAEFAAIDKQFADAKAPKSDTTTGSAGYRNEMDKASDTYKPAPASAPAKQSFGQAFKSAKDGSTFEWNGKQYKKEYATESTPSSTPKSDAPKTSANNTSVQTLAEQISDLNKRIDDPKVSAQDKKNFEYAREALRKQMVANASRTK